MPWSERNAQPLTPAEQSAVYAAEVSAALHRGWRPPAMPSTIVLFPREELVATLGVQFLQYYAQDVRYGGGGFMMFGGPFLAAASLVGSAIVNAHRRTEAERLAAAQWRLVDHGLLHLTTRRFALQLAGAWVDIPFDCVRASSSDGEGILLWYEGPQGPPPAKLAIPLSDGYFLLFRFLAYGEILDVELDPGLRERAYPAEAVPPPTREFPQLPQESS